MSSSEPQSLIARVSETLEPTTDMIEVVTSPDSGPTTTIQYHQAPHYPRVGVRHDSPPLAAERHLGAELPDLLSQRTFRQKLLGRVSVEEWLFSFTMGLVGGSVVGVFWMLSSAGLL